MSECWVELKLILRIFPTMNSLKIILFFPAKAEYISYYVQLFVLIKPKFNGPLFLHQTDVKTKLYDFITRKKNVT
jgi:hypothetical protein